VSAIRGIAANGRETLRERLVDFLRDTGRITGALAPDAPLITAGLIDSVTLFSLAVWIEEASGRPVDITRLALPAQWDTVARILDFVEQQAANRPAG